MRQSSSKIFWHPNPCCHLWGPCHHIWPHVTSPLPAGLHRHVSPSNGSTTSTERLVGLGHRFPPEAGWKPISGSNFWKLGWDPGKTQSKFSWKDTERDTVCLAFRIAMDWEKWRPARGLGQSIEFSIYTLSNDIEIQVTKQLHAASARWRWYPSAGTGWRNFSPWPDGWDPQCCYLLWLRTLISLQFPCFAGRVWMLTAQSLFAWLY